MIFLAGHFRELYNLSTSRGPGKIAENHSMRAFPVLTFNTPRIDNCPRELELDGSKNAAPPSGESRAGVTLSQRNQTNGQENTARVPFGRPGHGRGARHRRICRAAPAAENKGNTPKDETTPEADVSPAEDLMRKHRRR